MRQTRTAALAIILAAGPLALPAAGPDIDRARINPVLGSIVQVEAATTRGGYSLGTAVSVEPGKFVTSCHVTAYATRVNLLFDGLRWPVTAQSSDTEHDVCVLEVPSLQTVAPVRRGSVKNLHVGDSVVAIGYTFGTGRQAQTGTISALHPLDGSAVIQTTTPFNSGASGGGLFDADGALIGILTFRLPNASGYYFAVPADWITARTADTARYDRIAPLEGPRPFWARPPSSLPYFMNAATLEAAQDWPKLIALTEAWAAAEHDNPEPWLVRGHALNMTDRADAAIDSFRNAVHRAPKLALAWFDLGDASARAGQRDGLMDALEHLRKLDPDLAADLAVRGGVDNK